ncbi:MAG TPA: AraC family transcriptional regulator [Candidatus Kapabacteria bacterium]|nr:AraC family transcriptional regulator [Candidatus Kapabacteria bacterium]
MAQRKQDPEMLSALYKRIIEAKALMDEHPEAPLDLAQIADAACFSQYHFLRLFKKTYNKTPHQYLTEQRIERAKTLMANSDMTITDICYAVGFESLGSFSTLFKKHAGCPPLEFRERLWKLNTLFKEQPLAVIPHCFAAMCGLVESPGKESNSQ